MIKSKTRMTHAPSIMEMFRSRLAT